MLEKVRYAVPDSYGVPGTQGREVIGMVAQIKAFRITVLTEDTEYTLEVYPVPMLEVANRLVEKASRSGTETSSQPFTFCVEQTGNFI